MEEPEGEAETQQTAADQEEGAAVEAAEAEQQPADDQGNGKTDELTPDVQGDGKPEESPEATQEEAKPEIPTGENAAEEKNTEQTAIGDGNQDQGVTDVVKAEGQANENGVESKAAENVNGDPEAGQTGTEAAPSQEPGDNAEPTQAAQEEDAAGQPAEGGPVEEGALKPSPGTQEGAETETAPTGADGTGDEHVEEAQEGTDAEGKTAQAAPEGQVEEGISQAADEDKAQEQGEEEQKTGDDAEAAEPDIASEQAPESTGEETEGYAGDADEEDNADQPAEEASAKETVDTAEEDEEQTIEASEDEEHTAASRETSASAIATTASPGSAESGGGLGSSGSGSGSHDDEERDLTRLVERSSLEQQHRGLLLLRRQLLARNQRIQQRLSQHFSRKTDDAERVEKNIGEVEARYNRYLSGIRDQQRAIADEKQRRQQELAAFREQVDEQMALVAAEYGDVVELRRQVALKSRSSRTGRLMATAEVEVFIGREQQKEGEVQEARLESLRRETRLGRLEQILRESEELAGGIHLIDFEQLKIENQTYAEKIEERNEDLTKLRRKIGSTVQILTHLKERIQFEQTENARRERRLQTVSAEVTHGRESLAQLKQRRDHVRSRTVSQRATAGLLGHEALLRDFEARVDQEARLVKELHTLKREYAENQRMTQAIRHMERSRRQTAGSAGRH